MCTGCQNQLPTTGTRYMQTVWTPTGGTDTAYCSAACREAAAGRRRQPATGRKAA